MTAVRPLTTIERSLIQTFPSSFKFKGTKTNLEQIIGNAVPVKLAQYVATGVLKLFEDKSEVNFDKFSTWLQTKNNYTPRSIRDIVSRLKRLDRLSPLSTNYRTYIINIESNVNFIQLSKSVQSQLKKSYKLYLECLDFYSAE